MGLWLDNEIFALLVSENAKASDCTAQDKRKPSLSGMYVASACMHVPYDCTYLASA